MCSTPVVWLKPSREAGHLHHSAALQSAADPNTRDGTYWRQQSRRIRAFASWPRASEGGPQAMWTYGGFGMEWTRTAEVKHHHVMPFHWMTYRNASKPGEKCSRGWQVHTRA